MSDQRIECLEAQVAVLVTALAAVAAELELNAHKAAARALGENIDPPLIVPFGTPFEDVLRAAVMRCQIESWETLP